MTTEELKAKIRAIRSSGAKPNRQLAQIDPLVVAEQVEEPQPPPVVEEPPTTPQTWLKHDDCSDPNPSSLWGNAGDLEGSGTSVTRPATGIRRFTVPSGSTRAELGYNSRNPATTTFMRFYEGEVKRTKLSFRLSDDFPLSASAFNVVCQWKQAGPVGNTPVLALRAHFGKLRLINTDYRNSAAPQSFLWETPIQKGVWIDFELNCLYKVTGGWVEVNGGTRIGNLCTRFPDPSTNPMGCSHLRVGYYTGNGGGYVEFREMGVA